MTIDELVEQAEELKRQVQTVDELDSDDKYDIEEALDDVIFIANKATEADEAEIDDDESGEEDD